MMTLFFTEPCLSCFFFFSLFSDQRYDAETFGKEVERGRRNEVIFLPFNGKLFSSGSSFCFVC